jgi:crotonobetainyl-CoA:carnitine CoA-transferase CaiB-like acyl-CoA transferase
MAGPLSGVRVVEATFFQNGPFAGVMLADLGADVIKIEPPVTGDPGRGLGIPGAVPGTSTYFQAQNRSKRGITLDLTKPEGLEVAYRLIDTADVFLQNFRVGVAERLGLGYADLRARNPRLVYASVTGLGRQGPECKQGVLDPVGVARSGFLMATLREGEEPIYAGAGGTADQIGATTMAFGILGALFHRERTGEGQQVEASQLGSMILFQNLSLTSVLNGGAQVRAGGRHKARNPLSTTYPCADDKWLILAALQGDRYWPDFCRVLGRPDWRDDPRYATMAARQENVAEVVDMIEAEFRRRPRAEWLRCLAEAGIPAGPVQDYHQLQEDPQVVANRYLTAIPTDFGKSFGVTMNPVRYSATPVRTPELAPELGQHTEEVLIELGYDWDQISALREAGAI